jgi:hypothetical protein
MSYNPAIPTISDQTLQSQQQIRSNFQTISSTFSENHMSINDTKFGGMHKVVNFFHQAGDPITSATEIALYSKLVSSIPQLFFAPSSAQTPIQMTGVIPLTGLQSTNPDVYYPQQYSFMAGPFTIYGGKIHNPTVGQNVLLSPSSTLLYVGLTVGNSSNNVGAPIVSAAAPTNITGSSFNIGFQTFAGAPQFDVYYLAIGI